MRVQFSRRAGKRLYQALLGHVFRGGTIRYNVLARRERMRGRVGALFYCIATVAMMWFGLISLVSIGFTFVIIGLVMAVLGV
jgi:hypothetical protein